MMPSVLDAAKGAFSFPVVKKLRELANVPRNNPSRRRDAHAAVIELRAVLDGHFRSAMFGTLLNMARMKDREIPTLQVWVAAWDRISHKMQTDGKFVAALCDQLPEVLAKYNGADAVRIFGDPAIRELARRGMQ